MSWLKNQTNFPRCELGVTTFISGLSQAYIRVDDMIDLNKLRDA